MRKLSTTWQTAKRLNSNYGGGGGWYSYYTTPLIMAIIIRGYLIELFLEKTKDMNMLSFY